MPLTMSRINIVKGLGPVLQLAEGSSVNIPEKIHKILDERTDPNLPTTWFVPRLTGKGAFSDVYSVIANWGSNHAAVSCGHIGKELVTLASMLRIPVNMHNLSSNEIFRPASWSAFDTEHFTISDIAACKTYRPLYKKLNLVSF